MGIFPPENQEYFQRSRAKNQLIRRLIDQGYTQIEAHHKVDGLHLLTANELDAAYRSTSTIPSCKIAAALVDKS